MKENSLELYSQRAAARFVGISLTTFRRYAAIGAVRGVSVNGGGVIVYDRRELTVFKNRIDFPTRAFKRLYRATEPVIGWFGRNENRSG